MEVQVSKDSSKKMDREQAKKLGEYLRQARTAQGLSLLKLSQATGIHDVTLGRFESGAFAAPHPDKLATIAEALELSLADVFALAEYAVPTDLPSFTPYMRWWIRSVEKPSAHIDSLSSR